MKTKPIKKVTKSELLARLKPFHSEYSLAFEGEDKIKDFIDKLQNDQLLPNSSCKSNGKNTDRNAFTSSILDYIKNNYPEDAVSENTLELQEEFFIDLQNEVYCLWRDEEREYIDKIISDAFYYEEVNLYTKKGINNFCNDIKKALIYRASQ